MYGEDVDFYTIKGICEELFIVLGMSDKAEWSPSSELPYMHPGRLALVSVEGKQLGFVGEVHPDTVAKYGIDIKVYIAVLDIDMLVENTSFDKTFKPLPKFPAVQRDIAMLVEDSVIVKDIESIIKEKGGKLLESVQLFDVRCV